MESIIDGFEPKNLWKHFDDITKIPRPSKHEDKILQYLKNFANERSLRMREDSTGNIVVIRRGSNGGENAPVIVIQSHVDMVCEKNRDYEHDFMNDPLKLYTDGDWLKAEGTTLGADNGIGVAAALALLDMPKDHKLPPLECLFTVDEETGLTGAFALNGDIIKGRTMLNLDTEDWGEICIGCAGGGDSSIELKVDYQDAPPDFLSFQLSIEGLMGGHSGVDIHEERGNAIVFLASIIDALQNATDCRIVSMQGGDKHNAIPREAFATLLVSPEAMSDAQIIVSKRGQGLSKEFGSKEKKLKISFAGLDDSPEKTLTNNSQTALIGLLRTIPHGVLKYSHDVEGLVETSNNLAAVKCVDGNYNIVSSTRSSISDALELQRERIALMSKAYGAEVEQDEAYPGWAPDLNSSILETTSKIYAEMLDGEPNVCAIHAGLECGVIGEKVDGMDMISFGPTIKGPHSPDERVDIPSVKKFWDLLLKVLEELAGKQK